MASQGATDVLRNAHTDLSTAPTLRRLRPEEAAAPRIIRRGDTIDVNSGELEVLSGGAEEEGPPDWLGVDRSFLWACAGSFGLVVVAALTVLALGAMPASEEVVTMASSPASPPSVATATAQAEARPTDEPARAQEEAPLAEPQAQQPATAPAAEKRTSVSKPQAARARLRKARLARRAHPSAAGETSHKPLARRVAAR